MSDSKQLVEQIKSDNADVRFAAWNTAGPAGAEAVAPLADVMSSAPRDVAKAAKEALHRIVHFAARPYGAKSAREVSVELEKIAAEANRPRIVRVETINWIGYVGDKQSIPALVKLLADPVVREDARLALERIPGDESLQALKDAANTVPAEFKPNIQQSLYVRQLTPQTVGIKPNQV